MPNFCRTGAPHILKIQWLPLSILIFGQNSCFLGPTTFKLPQPNWHYYTHLYLPCILQHLHKSNYITLYFKLYLNYSKKIQLFQKLLITKLSSLVSWSSTLCLFNSLENISKKKTFIKLDLQFFCLNISSHNFVFTSNCFVDLTPK